MARQMDCTVAEMKAVLKKHYDGYHFSAGLLDIYNPFSIMNAFNAMQIENYWYRSGTPTYLAKLIEGHDINMARLTSQEYESQYFQDYKADAEDPLAMLYQSGYLTIKGYDRKDRVYALDYPNDEVKSGFVTLVANGYFRMPEETIRNWILNLNRMLRKGDLDSVRDGFTAFLSSIPYEANKDERARNFESHYQYTLYLILRLLSCSTTLIEKENSYGRADIIVESTNDIYIFEFKLDGCADEALRQINEMQYAVPYLTDPRKLHKIGVNISSETRTVAEWKVA